MTPRIRALRGLTFALLLAASPLLRAAPTEVFAALGCMASGDRQSIGYHTVQGGLAINCRDENNQGRARSSASIDAGSDVYAAYGYVTANADRSADGTFIEAAASAGAVIGIRMEPFATPPWMPDFLPVDLRALGFGTTSEGGVGAATMGLDFGPTTFSHSWSGDDPGSDARGELELWVDASSTGFNVVKGMSCLAQAYRIVVEEQERRVDKARCAVTFDPYAVFDQARFDAQWGDQSYQLDRYFRLSPSQPAQVFSVPSPASLGLALLALALLAWRRLPGGLGRCLTVGSLVAAAGPALAQKAFDPVTGLRVLQAPLPALVGVGDGTEFSVQAEAQPGVTILGYEWKRNGRPLKAGSKLARLRLTGLTSLHAGAITVDIVGSKGTLATPPVALQVVSAGWAPLSGRALPGPAALQAPSLSLCADPHVAWITPGTGGGDLQVHRFDGAAWQSLASGAAVSTPGKDAGEPSLQCGSVSGPAPVVAYSRLAAVGSGRTIDVKLLQQGQWLSVGAVAVAANADARAPLLRLMPEPEQPVPGALRLHIEQGSRLAWRESGAVRSAQWGGGWQNTVSSLQTTTRHALALDTTLRGPAGLRHPWLLATATPILLGAHRGRWAPRVQTDQFGAWTSVGSPVGAPAALNVTQQVVGLGFTATENSRPRAVMVWADGTSPYTLKSSTLFSTDYEDAMSAFTHVVPWQPYAADLSGNELQATAFDDQGFDEACYPFPPAAFALALSDRAGTRVLRTDCSSAGLPRWSAFAPTLPSRALALDLKMVDWQSPLLASVEAGPAGPQLVVWKLYR